MASKNFSFSHVATAPSPADSGTSLVVDAGEGARFGDTPFKAVVCPAGTRPLPSNAEVINVTNVSTDTFTIQRAQESSSARSIEVGDEIFAFKSAAELDLFVNGPASATDGAPALFDGTTGKVIKNSTPTGTGNPVLATSPALVTPNIGTPSAGVLTNATGLPTTGLVNGAVTADKLGTGADADDVATSQTTSSSAFTDLATAGPAVTVNIGVNGLALVAVHGGASNTSTAQAQNIGFAVSGANTIAASFAFSASVFGNGPNTTRIGGTWLLTGLNAGATTFTMKYRTSGNTATFSDRYLSVIPL